MFEEMATLLVIGNGGREHAICWKLAQSEEVWLLKFYVTFWLLFLYRVFMLCVISHCCCAVLSGLHNYDKQASGKWLLMVVRYNDYCCCFTHTVEQSLEKLIDSHLLKKLATFYGKWRFSTMLTTARHWIQSWARCAQFNLTSCFCSTYCSCFSEYVGNFVCVFKFILMTVTWMFDVIITRWYRLDPDTYTCVSCHDIRPHYSLELWE
jgi:hypothetical protein